MPPRRVLVILATGPEAGDLARAAALLGAAHRRGAPATLFAMHHGVRALAAEPALVRDLLDHGDVIGCATSADLHGVDLAALGVQIGSQHDHAPRAEHDVLVAFA